MTTFLAAFAAVCAVSVTALILDRLWRRSMCDLERDFYVQFPNGCLRCTATRTDGDSERADNYGWKHSVTCSKENR